MPSLRRIGAAAFLVILIFAVGPVARAQSAGGAFTVSGVEVDVTAPSAAAAKDQAIQEAQRTAFQRLLERMTDPADRARLPEVDGTKYARDFTVEKERALSGRYIATLSVRFNALAVRKLLRDAKINYAEPRTRPVVVVPVFKPNPQGAAVLWDDPNPWRSAWSGLGGGGLVRLTVPPGDLSDVQAISAEQALAGDPERIDAVSELYKGADVLVVAASLGANGKQLDVALSSSPNAPKPFGSVSYQLAEGESLDQMMARAAHDIQRAVDTAYKQPNLLEFDRAGTISALVPITGLQDWLRVRDGLGRVPQVRKWELVSLSKAEAAVMLHTVGDQEQVKVALARQGLDLAWGDGYWVIRGAGQ